MGRDRKGGIVITRSANANQTDDNDAEARRVAAASTRGSGASMMSNKVIFRHLPPTLTVDDFLAIISPLPEHRYFHYCKADYSAGVEAALCHAYIGLRRLDDVYSVCSKWDGYEFSDSKGFQYPALVEFAPNQRIPDRTADGSYQFLAPEPDTVEKSGIPPDPSLAKKPKKQNTLKGTLIDDDDFKVFCDKLTASRSAFVSGASEQPQPAIGPEQMLKEIEDRHKADDDVNKKKSPLVEFLEQRRRGMESSRRILQKSAGKGDRRGADASGSQQKKKRRDRRRERGLKNANAAAPVPGSVKIAKPPAKGNETEATPAKDSAEDEHQRQSKNRPVSSEQRKQQQRPAKDDGGSYHGKPWQQSRSQQGSSSKQQQTPKQSEPSSRNKDEDATLPAVPPGQNLRFVDTGDDDGDDGGSKQQRGGTRSAPKPSSGNRGSQQEKRRSQNEAKASPSDVRDNSSTSKQSFKDRDDFDFDDEEKPAKASTSAPRPTSGHSVGRTMVFSRSLAAAQQSTSGARPARFDPRRGNAAPPSGNS